MGGLRVNPASRVALLDDQPLTLTPVEFDLLAALARARGRVKSREQLLEEIRDRNYDVFDRSIDVHISALRRKLGDDAKEPRYIRTVRSAGYMLINPDAPGHNPPSMAMKLRFPLLPKILIWFFLNLVVLGAAFYFVLKVQFRFGWIRCWRGASATHPGRQRRDRDELKAKPSPTGMRC